MVYARRVAYISNELSDFPRSLGLMAALRRADKRSVVPNFRSEYGETDGPAGPSEAGPFWDLVFPWHEHHSVEPDDWPLNRRRFAARHISKLVEVFDAPFLCKNIWHSVRLEALYDAFPNSVFLVMRRDRLMTAQSILVMQRIRQAQSRGFWSVRPRELLAKQHLSLPQRVAWQILLTEDAIDRARARLGGSIFLDVDYEEFCRNPDESLERVDDFLSGHGIKLERRAHIGGPFRSNQTCLLEPKAGAEIKSVFAEAVAQHETSSLLKSHA